MKKFIAQLLLSLTIVLAIPASAFAHVVVKPAQVAPAARQVFTTGVPNEKEIPVVGVRVVVPEGLKSVRPHVKTGWNIEIKKTGEGENVKVTEIIWTGGQVGVDLRDEFLFSAQAPAEPTELKWKAYETYADGTVVAWDQEPKEGDENVKPYSVTKVAEETKAEAAPKSDNQRANAALALSAVALTFAVAFPLMRKK